MSAVDFSLPWARAKYSHAMHHCVEFFRQAQRFEVGDAKGQELLSLVFGDAVHNARSALDAAVWAVAIQESGIPPNSHDVKFPICTTESAWLRAMKPMFPLLPATFVERMLAAQPFVQRSGQESRHPLVHLHQIDIADKHKISLEARQSVLGFGLVPDDSGGFAPATEFEMAIVLPSGRAMSAKLLLGKVVMATVDSVLTHLESGVDLVRVVPSTNTD